MRKKIKLIFLSLGLSIVLIAGIIELGKILNVVSTQEMSQGFKETVVSAAPQWPTKHTEGSLGGANCSTMYNFAPGYYCARHEWEIARHMSHDSSSVVISDPAGGGRAQEITYEFLKKTEMTQSIAYAQNYEVGGKTDDWTMQRIIWGSWQFKAYTGGDCGLVEDVKEDGTWTTASNGMIGRSYQFANFVYKALDEEGHLGLTFEPEKDDDDSLRVLVDQKELKYTVGPYVLNFKNQDEGCVEGTGNELMKDLVYNEIMERNQGWSEENKFCTGKVEALITYEDGTHELTEVGVELLDASGNVMVDKFPKFGETFYLRYKTTLDEDIRYIRPSIQISHLKKMTDNGRDYEVWTYRSKHIKYSMITDQGDILITCLWDAMRACGYSGGFNIDMRAEVIGGHWEIRSLTHKRTKIMSYFAHQSPGSYISSVITNLIEYLKKDIKARGESWGLGDMDVTLDWVGCFHWLGNYYDDPSCLIVSKIIRKKWKRQLKDSTTGEYTNDYEYHEERSDDGNFVGPTGEGWELEEAESKAWVSSPLPGMENVERYVTAGSEEGAHRESQQAVQDWIDSQGDGLTVAFKILNLIIDEDILESQPNEKIEDVVPPEDWHEEEITLKEITGNTNPKEDEELADSLIKESTDWAVERADLPGKEINMYMGRQCMARHAVDEAG